MPDDVVNPRAAGLAKARAAKAAKKAAELAAPAPAQPEVVTPGPVPVNQDVLIARLMREVEELRAQVAGTKADDAIEKFGAPPPPRSARRYVMAWVNPYTQVRLEVPEGYKGPEAPKAFAAHDNTLLNT